MSRVPSEETDRRAEQAAYYAGVLNLSQAQIAEQLHMSPSNVSRLLARASKGGCYTKRVVHEFHAHKVSPQRLEELQGPQPHNLLSALQGVETETRVRVRRVTVLHAAGRELTDDTFNERLARFGRAAAVRVAVLIDQSKVVACTWGLTLSVVVDGLSQFPRSEPAGPPITFVPVCAEAEEFAGTRESSSALASRLNHVINGDKGPRLALTRVPAFIPKRQLNTDREDGVRELIWASRAYRDIFGTPKKRWSGATGGLVDRADMLLTSIGHADHPTGFNYDELLRAGKITAERLKSIVVGDIGGILIARGSAKNSVQEVAKLNRMWTGLEYERLKALAVRAADPASSTGPSTPGVVVVNCGANRSETLEAVVRRGLVNELIIDVDAAVALSGKLQIDSSLSI